MEAILGKVNSFGRLPDATKQMSVDEVRVGAGLYVECFSKLVAKLAQLAYENPEFVLLYRGQSEDHKVSRKSTLFPTIYRYGPEGPPEYGSDLSRRYAKLRQTEQRLYSELQSHDRYGKRIGRSELARWAILQHYQVCATPLLDATHSALVAISFAFLGDSATRDREYFLFVLGVPQVSGAVTVSASQAIQIVRLSSVCPPATLRPYVQDGYLIGTYPSVETIDAKQRYDRDEMDCARRLIAKFKIPTTDEFWDNGVKPIPKSALFPDETNDLIQQIQALKNH